MEKKFVNLKQRTVTDQIPFTLEDFIQLLKAEKPTEIFLSEYSRKLPYIIVTEYHEDGVTTVCSALADKTPKRHTFDVLHKHFGYQGMKYFYFNSNSEQPAPQINSGFFPL